MDGDVLLKPHPTILDAVFEDVEMAQVFAVALEPEGRIMEPAH